MNIFQGIKQRVNNFLERLAEEKKKQFGNNPIRCHSTHDKQCTKQYAKQRA